MKAFGYRLISIVFVLIAALSITFTGWSKFQADQTVKYALLMAIVCSLWEISDNIKEK